MQTVEPDYRHHTIDPVPETTDPDDETAGPATLHVDSRAMPRASAGVLVDATTTATIVTGHYEYGDTGDNAKFQCNGPVTTATTTAILLLRSVEDLTGLIVTLSHIASSNCPN